jgi:hypothetical protein
MTIEKNIHGAYIITELVSTYNSSFNWYESIQVYGNKKYAVQCFKLHLKRQGYKPVNIFSSAKY